MRIHKLPNGFINIDDISVIEDVLKPFDWETTSYSFSLVFKSGCIYPVNCIPPEDVRQKVIDLSEGKSSDQYRKIENEHQYNYTKKIHDDLLKEWMK